MVTLISYHKDMQKNLKIESSIWLPNALQFLSELNLPTLSRYHLFLIFTSFKTVHCLVCENLIVGVVTHTSHLQICVSINPFNWYRVQHFQLFTTYGSMTSTVC